MADYRAGHSLAAVARLHRVDVKTARDHLTRAGVEIRPLNVFPSASLPQLHELRNMGWSHQKLAEHFGSSRETIRKALLRPIEG